MHLQSVTLRGFKSFADRTRLDLDPGLVALVGPNGTGKSNLIDALVWALGTLSTRALRLERMEDVIFAGTTSRKQLGMAQVVLTFDNESGAFPVDFSSVEVGRTLFRDGASEYSLNGTSCRLLDVQELLSEAGIGREMHAVVAQGEVDDIVGSRPEELRAYVEEAAGISKHRRRKERALRKIDGVEADLSRVSDLASELRRQVRPLRKQAEAALRHREITERLREIRIRLLVSELEELSAERSRALQTRDGASEELGRLRDRMEGLRGERSELEGRLEDARGQASRMRRGLEHLRSAQAAALRGVVVLRERAHARPDVRRLDELVAKAEALTSQETEVRSSLEELGGRIAEREERLKDLRAERGRAEQEATEARSALTGVRDELREVDASGSAASREAIAARAEARSASERVERADERVSRLSQQGDTVRAEIERLDAEAGRAGLTVQRLEAEQREAAEHREEADEKLRGIASEAAVLEGRLESLRVARDLTASRRQGAETLRDTAGVEIGARGILGEIVRVASGLEAAVEAALGPALDALVVGGSHLADAVARAEEEGTDVLVATTLSTGPGTPAPAGTRPLAEAIEVPGWLRGTVDALLERTYLVDRWEDAAALASEHTDATFVTASGRLLRPQGLSRPARGGGPAALGLGDALERTEESLRRLKGERSRWTTNLDRRRRDLERLGGELDEARSRLHEIEGRIAAAADRLRELGAEEHASTLERDLAQRDHDERLKKAEAADARRGELESSAEALRRREEELDSRLAAATERAEEFASEAGDLEEGLTDLLTTRASLTERLRGIERATDELRAEEERQTAPPPDPETLGSAEELLRDLDGLVAEAEERVRASLGAEEGVEEELRRVGAEISRLDVETTALEPRSLQAAEAVTRIDVRLEEVGSRLARDHDIPPSRAREEFPPAANPEALRAEEGRLDDELSKIGPVNPLAAEEVVSLEERETFLEGQLEDLRSSKRDLLRLVRAAEGKMRELLVAATEDADARFREVIGLLFPEGDGRLRLTGDEDPLLAGLEIEVKLGRKGHRRLAFLSGGEKALAGLGFLFALHLARPTPFLVLDEVDAPLDDANLGRFLRLLDSLRQQTQVLVVTHQKRTMERADSLVGVTLNPDGTSRVVTQGLRESERGRSPYEAAGATGPGDRREAESAELS